MHSEVHRQYKNTTSETENSSESGPDGHQAVRVGISGAKRLIFPVGNRERSPSGFNKSGHDGW